MQYIYTNQNILLSCFYDILIICIYVLESVTFSVDSNTHLHPLINTNMHHQRTLNHGILTRQDRLCGGCGCG